MTRALDEISEIVRYKEFLRNLVMRDIKVRYKRSVLGFLWVMLNPLLMMLILSTVFSEVFKVSTKNYTTYLISGIILWNFFSQSTVTSLRSIFGNGNLIKKVYVPKAIFPLSIILSAMINFVFSLVPLLIIFFITGTSVSLNIYLVPVIIILVALFSFGISLILSTLTVFFHDTIYIYDVLLLAWMYATPIFFPESIIPQRFLFILNLNPLYYFLTTFRAALFMDGSFIFGKLMCSLLFSLAALAAGLVVYSRYRDRLIYYL
ncbi:MAG TPA: ABC transporter permease [Thermodesulfovibrionales bacterium]|nr:ABC transporter permease [Thermodesulfovibrionales bacterium]